MQTIREITVFVLGLIVWAVFIFGPFALLVANRPWLALGASVGALVAFATSFRWRTGFSYLLSCLGMILIMYNAATFCLAGASIARTAGASSPIQIVAGIIGLPLLVLCMLGVARIEEYILGPKATRIRDAATDAANTAGRPH